MNKLKQLPFLLCGLIFFFASSCEREEDTLIGGEVPILIPPTGDPVAVTFPLSENTYG